MFKAIKEFFVGKSAPVVDAVAPGGAPYKVEAPWTLPEPAATTPVPLEVESPAPRRYIPKAELEISVQDTTAPVVSSEDRTVVSLETPVNIQNEQYHNNTPTVATVTVESPAKATRSPRAPKSVPVEAVKEKTPAKAKVPKLTVVKAEKPSKSKKV